MERDLATARLKQTQPWVVVTTHRPMYSSDTFEHEQHLPGSEIQRAIEPLLLKYHVDLMITGHCQCVVVNIVVALGRF